MGGSRQTARSARATTSRAEGRVGYGDTDYRSREEDRGRLDPSSLQSACGSLIPSCRGSALPCLVGENQHLRSCDGGVILSGPEETLSKSSEELPLFESLVNVHATVARWTMPKTLNAQPNEESGASATRKKTGLIRTKSEDEGRPLSTPWWTYIRIQAPTPCCRLPIPGPSLPQH